MLSSPQFSEVKDQETITVTPGKLNYLEEAIRIVSTPIKPYSVKLAPLPLDDALQNDQIFTLSGQKRSKICSKSSSTASLSCSTILQMGEANRFRDELEYLIDELGYSGEHQVDLLKKTLKRLKNDVFYAQKMRYAEAAGRIYDQVMLTSSSSDVLSLTRDIVLTLAVNGDDLLIDCIPDWKPLLKRFPTHLPLIRVSVIAESMVAEGGNMIPENLVKNIIDSLIEAEEWELLDMVWHRDPETRTLHLTIDQVKHIVGNHNAFQDLPYLPTLITLTGTKQGSTLVHQANPNLFKQFIEQVVDHYNKKNDTKREEFIDETIASSVDGMVSILINLLDRAQHCPHRIEYANTITEGQFKTLMINSRDSGLLSILVLLLYRLRNNEKKTGLREEAILEDRVKEFIEALREEAERQSQEQGKKLGSSRPLMECPMADQIEQTMFP